MKKNIVIISIVIIIFAVIGIVWWKWMPTSAPKYTGSVEKIVIANQREYSIFNLIAKDKGYFKRNGLDAEVKEYQSGPVAMTDLLAGKVDVAIAGEFVGVSYLFTNNNLRIFTETSKEETFQVIARKDKGINNPADLKGKKIGVTKKSSGEFFLGRFLNFNNLFLSDVSIIDLQPLEMASQIDGGQIDALITFGSYPYNIQKKLGENAVIWSAQGDQNTYALLYSTDEYIKGHPQIIERYLQSLAEAEQYVKTHDAETKKIVAKDFNYDNAYVNYFWPKTTFNLALEQGALLALENETRWAIQNKLTNQTVVPNYLNFIYFDAITKIKPEAVTIIH